MLLLLQLCETHLFLSPLFWLCSSCRVKRLQKNYIAPVNVVRFNCDGTLLASGGDDKSIMLWEHRYVNLSIPVLILRYSSEPLFEIIENEYFVQSFLALSATFIISLKIQYSKCLKRFVSTSISKLNRMLCFLYVMSFFLRREGGYMSSGFGQYDNVESWVLVKSLRKHTFGMCVSKNSWWR